MQIELSKDEAQALLGLLDVAVKAGGLQVAQHALPLAVKVQKAMDAEAKAKEVSEVSGDYE